eukprot:1153489-Pelagomonas_calceolata.AAC.1
MAVGTHVYSSVSTDERAEMYKPEEVPPHGTPSALSRLSVYEHHAWTPAKSNTSYKLGHSISGMQTRTWLILGRQPGS